MTVRLATSADEEQLMCLCRALHAENGQHDINEPKVRAMIQRAVAQQGAIIGVIGNPDDLRGMILLLIDPVWYSDEFQLLEIFNFVREDSRRSSFARDLINYAKRCADETGLDLTIGVLSNVRMAAKVRLYSRLLPKGGEFFVYSPSRLAKAA